MNLTAAEENPDSAWSNVRKLRRIANVMWVVLILFLAFLAVNAYMGSLRMPSEVLEQVPVGSCRHRLLSQLPKDRAITRKDFDAVVMACGSGA